MTIKMAAAILALALSAGVQDKPVEKQDQHHKDVNERGDRVMGFSHEKTTHHFRLYEDGGAIEVTANDAQDTESREQIRMHLRHIAGMFAEGNFDSPMLIHGVNPPGTATMKKLREKIAYKYEDADGGARVRISSADGDAVRAVHEFLQFQIKDHQTGDSGQAEKSGK